MVEHFPKTEFITGGPTIQIVRQDHPVGCPVDTVAPAYARLRRSPVRRVAPAQKPGAHTIEILGELGYTKTEIKELQKTHVVAEALSSGYLPD